MNLVDLKKSLVDNFDASWHSISRMQTRGIEKEHMKEVIQTGRIIYCLDDVVKFMDDKIIIVVSKLSAKIITVMVQCAKVGKPSKARKNRIAKKKRRSWKRKL